MTKARLVFRTNKEFCALDHLLHHHSGGIRNLHHTVKLCRKDFLGTDVQGHTTHIALMYRSHNLSHHRIATFLGKVHQLLL